MSSFDETEKLNTTFEYDSDSPYDEEIESKKFKDISTMNNYEDIEEADIETLIPLRKHQLQSLTRMVEAETEEYVEDENGRYRSKIGVLANKPGSGKTGICAALAVGLPELDPDEDSMLGYSSSLVNIKLSHKDEREYIPTTVIVCPPQLIKSAWIKNIEMFIGNDVYFVVGTHSENTANASKQNSSVESTTSRLQELTKMITSIKGKIKRKTAKQIDIDNLAFYEEEKRHLKASKKSGKRGTEEKMNDPVTMQYIIDGMRKYPIVLCPSSSFNALIPIFAKYEITRLIVDELQQLTATGQDSMKEYATNPVIEFLYRSKRSTTSFRELSPARFIWLVTATPHQLGNNIKGHFFNHWIDSNAPFLRDYLNSTTGKYVLPAMVAKYIIKFPDDYIEQFMNGGKKFMKRLTLKSKSPNLVSVLNGTMGDEFDVLLQNDSIDEILKKLDIEGTSINDPNFEVKVIEATINKLQDEIAQIRKKEDEYKKGGNSTILENNQEKIDEKEAKIRQIQRKLNILSLVDKLNNGEEPSEEEQEELNCPICYESVDELSNMVTCPHCWSVYHFTPCFTDWMKKNKSCPNCRKQISLKDLCRFNVSTTVNESGEENEIVEIGKETITEDIVFDSKKDAILEIIGETDDDEIKKTRKVPDRSDDDNLEIDEIRKTLLYLNTGTETRAENQIIRGLLDNGIYVFYNRAFSKPTLVNMYGSKAQTHMISVQKKGDLNKYIEQFRKAPNKAVFIMQNKAESVGLDFPFVDAIITYSDFGKDNEKQITHRAEREGRERDFFYIVLDYDQ